LKILATFDGSPMSESALTEVSKIARDPGDEVTLLSIVGRTPVVPRMRGPLRPSVSMTPLAGAEAVVLEPEKPRVVEAESQALEREVGERIDYLEGLRQRLPPSVHSHCEVVWHDDPARAIIESALKEQPDLIIMTTHGHTGLVHILFGDVAEEVVRSGAAPVLLVHPTSVRDARRTWDASDPTRGGR
jgi:nucleotide-binding universal stress UspA family protein